MRIYCLFLSLSLSYSDIPPFLPHLRLRNPNTVSPSVLFNSSSCCLPKEKEVLRLSSIYDANSHLSVMKTALFFFVMIAICFRVIIRRSRRVRLILFSAFNLKALIPAISGVHIRRMRLFICSIWNWFQWRCR